MTSQSDLSVDVNSPKFSTNLKERYDVNFMIMNNIIK